MMLDVLRCRGPFPDRNRIEGLFRAIGSCTLVRGDLVRFLFLLLCPFLFFLLGGATYVVPDYTETIQAAIDSAATGDTVLVREGTYVENLSILDKALTLKALGTPEGTVIDGNQQGSVLEITGDAHIEGFTIRNGLNEDGGGIRVFGDAGEPVTVSVVGNIIVSNRAGYFSDQGLGEGIMLYASVDCRIEGNTIQNNYAGDSGGGISVSGLDTQVVDNEFVANGCHVAGGAILLDFFSPGTTIRDNLVLENWSDSFGGGISNNGSGFPGYVWVIQGNTIVKNYHNNGAFVGGAGIGIAGGPARIEANIVALNHGPEGRGTGVGIRCATHSGEIVLRCNDAWGNDVDFDLFGVDTTGLGNFSMDPLFCDPENGDYSLASESPCREDGPSGCGLIGLFGVGCQQTPIVPMTWGRIKTAYGEPR